MKKSKISLNNIEAFVFDFDGVLTNNLVHLSQDGKEWVSCSRADGLAFDVLRKLKIPAYILSTEKNLVVTERAKKLKIQALQGVSDKVKALKLFSDFDVNGDDRYYRFTVDMRTRFEQGLVDGKKARDMVNPRHPDFIFQDKSSFVPSKDELINNFKNKLKIEGVSKLDDTAIAPPQRQEGQTLDDYKKTDAYIRWSTSPLYDEWLKRRSSQ